MHTRELKGLELAARARIVRDGEFWSVASLTSGNRYRVDPAAPSCSCEDFGIRGPSLPCKHIFAVQFVIEREKGSEPTTQPVTEPESLPATKRPTYRQNWPAYLRAQTTEKKRFQVLLADLCSGVEEPPRIPGPGQARIPHKDAVFAMVFKVYGTVSARRFGCDLDDAYAAGHLSRPIHPHKISAFMENAALTPVLHRLIEESAAPLAAVETDFACDSSAFSTSKFVRWFDVKHGKMKSEHVWLKIQIACGVKTNVVTTCEVCEQDGPDSPYLPGLVATTAERFTINEVSADKGYSSVAAHEAIAAAGGTPFIAFKRTASGQSGGLWQRMFHYFSFRRDDFLKHYHKRSNVESVFSAVKRKFGDSLRSKTRESMVNELLCKILANNVTVLIQEQEELGIAPEFWTDDEPEADSMILKFPDRSKMG